MGSIPMYGKSSHIWEVFPYMETESCMVTNMFGDQQHVIQGLWRGGTWPREMADRWHTGGRRGPAGVYPPIIWTYTLTYLGSLPICGKSSHLWEVSPYVGSISMYAKSSHIQEDFPHMGDFPYMGSLAGKMKFV
jgi:hypothetical protein